MGNTQAQIKRPYYDKYFGPDYYKKIGDNLGENGEYKEYGQQCFFVQPAIQLDYRSSPNYVPQPIMYNMQKFCGKF